MGDPPQCSVVFFQMSDDDSTKLIVRVYGLWVYVSVDVQDLKVGSKENSVLEEYTRLVSASRADSSDDQTGTKTDSGYSSEHATEAENDGNTSEEENEADPTRELQAWIMAPLAEELAQLEPSDGTKTLEQWYNCTVHMFELVVSGTSKKVQLTAKRRTDLDGTKLVRDNVTPCLAIPKYIRSLKKLPWYSPNDIEVVSEADDIHLDLHPTHVRIRSQDSESSTREATHFLKLTAKGFEKSVKREITTLHKIQGLGLASPNFRAPRLEGLIGSPSHPKSKSHILGFLLSIVPEPSMPLPAKLATKVSPRKKEQWSKDADEMVNILHKNGIVWGDAKADNFMVDKDDRLWMIDFGGGYTEGWVDPKMIETKKGDKDGLKQIKRSIEDVENQDSASNNPKRRRKNGRASTAT